ncbi:MAG TPA: glycosyltransferase family 2 protein [Candidatus Paceibacterota bacterium]|nr:glycosyltransferase family 2 protein [Candidatus Paceibacterota bacterium]
MKIVVIIPTYNEAGAIGSLLHDLANTFSQAPEHDWHVLVVDGASTDGTRDVVRKFMERHPNVHLLEEPLKRGLASAYLSGMAHATHALKADAYVEFDGDGQHDPKYLLPMARALAGGADYVIGSRYVPGGSVPHEWALYNKLLSRLGSLYSRLLLELPVHDVTSGLKMTRVDGFADKLPQRLEDLLTRYYAYKIQFLARMVELGAKIEEVPIAFRYREHGTSKSTWRDIIQSLKVTAIIRLKTIRQWRLLRVVAIGGIGFVLQGIIFELLGIQFKLLSPSTAALIGAEVAIISNFFLNDYFSFSDKRLSAAPFVQRIARFHLISSGSVASQWIFIFIAERLTQSPPLLRTAFVLGVVLGFAINYAGYYFWVWRKEK